MGELYFEKMVEYRFSLYRFYKRGTKPHTNNTKDYIFLLSCDEAETYFDFAERAVKTTLYARKQGAWFLDDYKDEHHNNGTWWLRYPNTLNKDIVKGESDLYTVLSCVNFDGYIEGAAEEVTGTRCCVRPAFWLKAE